MVVTVLFSSDLSITTFKVLLDFENIVTHINNVFVSHVYLFILKNF